MWVEISQGAVDFGQILVHIAVHIDHFKPFETPGSIGGRQVAAVDDLGDAFGAIGTQRRLEVRHVLVGIGEYS